MKNMINKALLPGKSLRKKSVLSGPHMAGHSVFRLFIFFFFLSDDCFQKVNKNVNIIFLTSVII